MDIINNAMLYALNWLHDWVNNYGLAIVLLTVLIRVVLWPANTQQTLSMRKMQELQPKIKALQEKHKDDPMKMQQAMMKFYSENKFNPMAGCLPMLIQLPIFIGLYGALNSPEFMVESVHERFLFVDKLYATLQSHAGEPLDGAFNVDAKDNFSTARMAKLTLTDGKVTDMHIADTKKVISVFPQPIIPGSPIELRLDFNGLGITDPAQQQYYSEKLAKVELLVIDNNSKELEQVSLNKTGDHFSTTLPTTPGKNQLDVAVLILVGLYGVLTLLYQKVMSVSAAKPAADDMQARAQARMMKMLPLIFVVMMFFIPIPAGVMIYLVVTTAMMFIQTAWVNYRYEQGKAEAKPAEQVIEINAKS